MWVLYSQISNIIKYLRARSWHWIHGQDFSFWQVLLLKLKRTNMGEPKAFRTLTLNCQAPSPQSPNPQSRVVLHDSPTWSRRCSNSKFQIRTKISYTCLLEIGPLSFLGLDLIDPQSSLYTWILELELNTNIIDLRRVHRSESWGLT